MYKSLIFKFIVFDTVIGFIPVVLGLCLIYIGIKNIKRAINSKPLFLISTLLILLGLSYFYSIRANFLDYYKFLKIGRRYLVNKTCKVIDDISYTLPSTIFGNENIKCDDGNWYHVCYQRICQRIKKRGKVFKLLFLPESKIIIKMQKRM